MLIGGVILILLLGWPVWAYEEIPVTNGGTLTGTITLTGSSPRPMAFNLATIPDPVYCGRISTGTGWRIVEDFLVSPDNGLKDVVVMLKGVEHGKAFELPNVSIEAKDCEFYPFISSVRLNRKKTFFQSQLVVL